MKPPRSSLWILLSILFASGAFGAESLKPRKPHPKPSPDFIRAQRHNASASVKFVEGSGVRLRNGKLVIDAQKGHERLDAFDASILPAQLARVNGLLSRYGVTVRPMFSRPEAALAADREEGERRSRRQLADLSLWYMLRFDRASADEMIDALVALNALDIVEAAQPAPRISLTTTPSYVGDQTYLGASPLGLGITSVWSESGGRGSGMKFSDVEIGWMTTSHEDLPSVTVAGTNSTDPLFVFHSTGVRGILNAIDNSYGVTGIANLASVYGSSVYDDNGELNLANAIDTAAEQVEEGDVILIEVARAGCVVTPPQDCPSEFEASVFDAIKQATGSGHVVIEGAGNTSHFLDAMARSGDPTKIFDPNNPDVDSGAIIVGGGTSDASHERWTNESEGSNYGARLDVQGWGENIWTTGCLEPAFDCEPTENPPPSQTYTPGFGGTSGATAMIAGAAGVINSIRKARNLEPFTSKEMRDALLGGAVAQGNSQNERIGPFPNVAAVIAGMSLESPVTTATGTASSVVIEWPAVSGATDYRVYRANSGLKPLTWTPVGTTSSLTLTDSNVSGGTTYMYSVRSRNAAGYESLPPGKPDLATTIQFSDANLQGQPIRAKYMVELHTAANSVCAFAGTAHCASAPYSGNALSESYFQTQYFLASYFTNVWSFAEEIREDVGAKSESRIATEPAENVLIDKQHVYDLRRIVN